MTNHLRITSFGILAAFGVLTSSVRSEALVGLNGVNGLLSFDSATPNVTVNAAISGLTVGERIISIDYRNPDNQIYGLGSLGNLYKLNAITGAATQVASNVIPVIAAASTASYEIDLNTQNNNLRVIGNAAAPNSNSAFSFATGITAVQTPLTRTGGALDVVGAAYNQNFIGSPAASLNLYFIDATSDALYVNNNAFAGGVLSKVGDLTLNGNLFGISAPTGFDITASGKAFVSSGANLYSLDLTSGALAVAGQIGATQGSIIGLTGAANVPLPASFALTLAGLGLVGFSRKFSNRANAQQL